MSTFSLVSWKEVKRRISNLMLDLVKDEVAKDQI